MHYFYVRHFVKVQVQFVRWLIVESHFQTRQGVTLWVGTWYRPPTHSSGSDSDTSADSDSLLFWRAWTDFMRLWVGATVGQFPSFSLKVPYYDVWSEFNVNNITRELGCHSKKSGNMCRLETETMRTVSTSLETVLETNTAMLAVSH